MNPRVLIVVAVVLVAALGWYLYQSHLPVAKAGEYAYVCDNGSKFSITPSSDVSSIEVFADAPAMFSGTQTLHKMGDGNHFENGTTVLSGAGEEVWLEVDGTSTVCNPVPNTEMAPWNWGDAAEGAGEGQDLVSAVIMSIPGKWQSAEDSKFVREFIPGGEVNDWYDGAIVATGYANVFTSENPRPVDFALEENMVYFQLTMSGSQTEQLNFRLNKLTPDELELTYLDRGGVLRFTRVR